MTMHPLFDLSGRVAVVTGAGRGLGRAAALGMAQFGAHIAALDLSQAACVETQRAIEQLGRRCSSYACDEKCKG